MRPGTRANCWLGIVAIIALVMSVLSSPIRLPQASNGRVNAGFLCRNFARVSSDTRLTVASDSVAWAPIDADGADCIEEKDEDESSWSFSGIDSPTFIRTVSPSPSLSGSRPDAIPPIIISVPLRC